jgi:Tfp pilus assembly protein PilF
MKFKERVAVAIVNKTTWEEKVDAIHDARILDHRKRLKRRIQRIMDYLQSCDRPQTAREICKGIKTSTKRSIKKTCLLLALMGEIQREKRKDASYYYAEAAMKCIYGVILMPNSLGFSDSIHVQAASAGVRS